MVTWVLQQGSFPAGCGFSLLFSLLLGLLIEWEGLFHVSIYHTSFFLSFKQFARCLCSISTLGAEHSSHWGSWPLVSRGVVKKTFLAWEMKSKTLGEAWFLGVARVLFEGLSLRVSVVDIILCLYWKPSQSGPGLPDFQNNDEGGVRPYRAGV